LSRFAPAFVPPAPRPASAADAVHDDGGRRWQRLRNYARYSLEAVADRWPLGRTTTFAERVVDGLSIRTYAACTQDAALQRAWLDLYHRTTQNSPFLCPGWHVPILRPLEPLNRARVVTAWRGESLDAVLPLRWVGPGAWESAGTLMTDDQRPLIAADAPPGTLAAMVHAMSDLRASRVTLACQPAITLDPTDEGRFAEKGWRLSRFAEEAVTHIPLAKTWDAFLATLDAHDRKELRRKLKNAETKADAELREGTTADEVRRDLDVLIPMMRHQGGGKGLKARWVYPRHFGYAVPLMAPDGRLRTAMLHLNGQPAAGMICLPTGDNRLILWCGPGIVLFAMLIRRGIELGLRELDLLRGQNDYKYRLGGVDRPLWTLRFDRVGG
jgi:CelD/BcsL family acetyltransferase involved in cellulose biosynthesis